MITLAFFDYWIASVAMIFGVHDLWGAAALLDLGIIGCFFPFFSRDAETLNSIAVLFTCI
jgi:hypothetical protein